MGQADRGDGASAMSSGRLLGHVLDEVDTRKGAGQSSETAKVVNGAREATQSGFLVERTLREP